MELRVDSYKIVTQLRRPVAQRMTNNYNIIYEIMKLITYLAVVSNVSQTLFYFIIYWHLRKILNEEGQLVLTPYILTFFYYMVHLLIFFQAFVIAYSSEFIPRLVYYYMNNFNLDGYLNFTLSGTENKVLLKGNLRKAGILMKNGNLELGGF